MRFFISFLASVLIIPALAQGASAADQGFLFGTITTESGERFTGRIRWDKNEGFWDDILDATKYDEERFADNRPKRRPRVSLFGLNIISTGEYEDWSSSSQLRFGHIESIIPRSRGRAVVVLKSGDKIRFEDSGTDIGSNNRGIQVFTNDHDVIDLSWSEIDEVVFFPEPDDYRTQNPSVERLFGRLTTQEGETYTGFICWDADEIYSTDILDGEEDGRDRNVPMGTIESITRAGSDACRVRTKSGREMKLSGTNDVNSGLRGIQIQIPSIGQIKVTWEEFESVTFLPIPTGLQPTYNRFDGGRPLRGTVTDREGETYTGAIVWDNDERSSWEFLNGEAHRVKYDIEFAQIAAIKRRSSRAAVVTLRNGTEVELRGSNDVDDGCRGIYIQTSDGLHVLEWDEFDRVDFE